MDYEIIADHTIDKFKLVSKYATGWARKILGYDKSGGLIFIDCMCNCGVYYDKDMNIIEGTAVRVAREINNINMQYQKSAILYFNDKDENKINHLKGKIESLNLQFITVHYFNIDANDLLTYIKENHLIEHNTLLFYDPYQANIDWDALEPYFNCWGEVIINHMASDVIRGSKSVRKPYKIAKYEKTYQSSIDEIIEISNSSNNRDEFEKMVNSIIESRIYKKDRKYYVASFPFYIKTNQYIYSLIFFSGNVNGIKLFKKTAWDLFGGQSSKKNTNAKDLEGQMSFDMDNGNIKKDVRPGIYTVYDIAKHVYERYHNRRQVTWREIYDYLDEHPIFPCDGYKQEIKRELNDSFKTINKREVIIFKGDLNE